MIGRMWRGYTTRENAAAYAHLLETEVFPGIASIAGTRGAYLMRREVPEGVEFVTLTLFDSLDAVRAFAGPDYEKAVIHGEAARLLSRYDERSVHFEVVLGPEGLNPS
jgi:heme-degrading monooxygenase HmoA